MVSGDTDTVSAVLVAIAAAVGCRIDETCCAVHFSPQIQNQTPTHVD